MAWPLLLVRRALLPAAGAMVGLRAKPSGPMMGMIWSVERMMIMGSGVGLHRPAGRAAAPRGGAQAAAAACLVLLVRPAGASTAAAAAAVAAAVAWEAVGPTPVCLLLLPPRATGDSDAGCADGAGGGPWAVAAAVAGGGSSGGVTFVTGPGSPAASSAALPVLLLPSPCSARASCCTTACAASSAVKLRSILAWMQATASELSTTITKKEAAYVGQHSVKESSNWWSMRQPQVVMRTHLVMTTGMWTLRGSCGQGRWW